MTGCMSCVSEFKSLAIPTTVRREDPPPLLPRMRTRYSAIRDHFATLCNVLLDTAMVLNGQDHAAVAHAGSSSIHSLAINRVRAGQQGDHSEDEGYASHVVRC